MGKRNLNRRRFLKWSAAGLLALGLPVSYIKLLRPGGRGPSSLKGKGAYNVLFITADDIGWKDLSCDGNTNIRTPHLDSLAEEGIRFEKAFGVSSSCSSSRASFITGQYISTHGVDGLTHRYPTKQLSPFHPTMARRLRKAGYHTAIQGKWHVAPFIPVSFYGYGNYLGAPVPWNHIKNTRKIDQFFSARSRDKNPFYLELNLTDTHRTSKGVFDEDPDFVVDPSSIQVPEWMGLPDWPVIRQDLALYYGKLLRTDHLVGETLEALRKHNLDHNTIVVFVSDNGNPFPGNKMTLLDRGIGTPLIFRLPGKIAPNRVSRALVSTIDIMPTVLDLCSVSYGEEVEGQSLVPLLLDDKNDHHRDQVLSEMNCHVKAIPMRAIRTERWKAILNLTEAPVGLDDLENVDWAMKLCEREDQPWLRPRVPFELYDLEADPHERRNLAGMPEVAETEALLRRELNNWDKAKARRAFS